MDDTVVDHSREFFFRYSERRMYLLESAQKVRSGDLHVADVVGDTRHSADLDVSVERKGRGAPDQTLQLGTGEVLGQAGQLVDVDIRAHNFVLLHLRGMNIQDLHSACLIGKRDLYVDFETTRSQKRVIDHVLPVRHTDDENVVELIHSVHLWVRPQA